MGQGGAAAEEDAVEIGGHHLAPLLVGDFGRLAAFEDAGVVDQNIQPAKALDHGRHHGLDSFAIRYVARWAKVSCAGSSFATLANGISL